MNVRAQLFGQKWQRVDSSLTALNFEIDRGVDADERREPLARDHAAGLHRGADRARLARVRVDVDLGAGNARLDVVDLRLERGQVVLRPALQHELLAQLRHARDLDDVLPDVLGQHLRQPGEQLLLREALLLEVDAVGVEEHRAAVAELGRQLGLERDVGVVGDLDAELVGHRLQQHAVAGRALVRQAEVLDVAVLHEQDLDVLAADVADDVDVAEVVRRRHHVGDGLDDAGVRLDRLLEHVGGVAGRAEALHLQDRALVGDVLLQARQDLLGVGDRVALGQHVRLLEQLARVVVDRARPSTTSSRRPCR